MPEQKTSSGLISHAFQKQLNCDHRYKDYILNSNHHLLISCFTSSIRYLLDGNPNLYGEVLSPACYASPILWSITRYNFAYLFRRVNSMPFNHNHFSRIILQYYGRIFIACAAIFSSKDRFIHLKRRIRCDVSLTRSLTHTVDYQLVGRSILIMHVSSWASE